MFPEYVHAPPALLSILLIRHDVLAANTLDTLPLAADAAPIHPQGDLESQVEILAMPRARDVTFGTLNYCW